MPRVYDKLGIRFLYPDNWTLDEDEAIQGNRSVTALSPGGVSGRSPCIPSRSTQTIWRKQPAKHCRRSIPTRTSSR